MSKLSHSNDDTMAEIEQRALFNPDENGRRISEGEAFEILSAAGVTEIKWSPALDAGYTQWMYFNLK